MLKLKVFSLVFLLIMILSSCHHSEDENIIPIDTSVIEGFNIQRDSVKGNTFRYFTDLPKEDQETAEDNVGN